MATSVAAFLKVSTTDGRTFYINPHHVTAVEVADGGVCVHLHSGEKISAAEKVEQVLQALQDLPGAAGHPVRQRLRERRRRGRSA